MNKQGSVVIYGMMLAITIIVLVLALAPVVSDAIQSARNETDLTDPNSPVVGMNCSTTTNNFVKAGCLAADISIFYWVGGLLFLAGAVVTAKIYF